MGKILADGLVDANQLLVVRANLPAGRNDTNDEVEVSFI